MEEKLNYDLNQSIEYEYIGFWARVFAGLIDIVIFLIPVIALLKIIDTFTRFDFSYLEPFIFYSIYEILLVGLKGATIGNLLLEIKVINKDGNKIGLKNSSIRYFGKALSTLPLFLGFFTISFDLKKQGFHDKLSKSFVIKK